MRGVYRIWAVVLAAGVLLSARGALAQTTALGPSETVPPDCAVVAEATAWTFAQAQERLTRCNRELRGAVQALAAPRADQIVAGQRPNPSFTGGLSNFNPQTGLGSGPMFDRQIDYFTRIDQLIERGDKRTLRQEVAGRGLQAAQQAAAEVLRQQRLALALGWIDLWGAQQRLALQDEVLTLVGRTLEAARARLRAGDIPAADVARIELDLQRAEADRLAAQGELARTRGLIAERLALPASATGPTASDPWPALTQAALDAVDVGLSARPDLAALRAQQAQAEAQARLVRAQQTRDVGIGLQAERYAPPAGNGWLLGAFVTVPLFVNHRFEGEIARAEADRDIAAQARHRLEATVLAEQQRATAGLLAARARRERLERDALPLAQRVVANAEFAYRKGAGTVLELLDALRQQRALQLDALDARLDHDRAEAILRAVLLSPVAAADPVFGEVLRWAPTP